MTRRSERSLPPFQHCLSKTSKVALESMHTHQCFQYTYTWFTMYLSPNTNLAYTTRNCTCYWNQQCCKFFLIRKLCNLNSNTRIHMEDVFLRHIIDHSANYLTNPEFLFKNFNSLTTKLIKIKLILLIKIASKIIIVFSCYYTLLERFCVLQY